MMEGDRMITAGGDQVDAAPDSTRQTSGAPGSGRRFPQGRQIGGALAGGGAAAAVLLAAGVARVACPGGCQACESCVASIATAGSGFLAVGGTMAVTKWAKRHRLPPGETAATSEAVGPQVEDQT
jgi:hypothetical protein